MRGRHKQVSLYADLRLQFDLLRLPDGSGTRLKVRSLVGLPPLCAATVIEPWQRECVPVATAAVLARMGQMPELLASIHPTGPGHLGVNEQGIFALINPQRLRRIISRTLDENEFLGPCGIRSLSKFHEQHPCIFNAGGQEYRFGYLPAESDTGMFGGNSNWRGPIWFPVNTLIIRALLNFYLYYGDSFHGDNGAGLGASHQTGWTGIVAKLIQLFGSIDAKQLLASGKEGAFKR